MLVNVIIKVEVPNIVNRQVGVVYLPLKFDQNIEFYMAKSDMEENYDELKNSHKTSKIDVPMTFEHLYIFSKFRFSIPITIANKYICMKFAKCDGRADGHTDRHKDRST